MANPTFTPGTWVAKADGDITANGKIIASCFTPNDDAKVMAASKELLEALILARRHFTPEGDQVDFGELLNTIDAAIKKTTLPYAL